MAGQLIPEDVWELIEPLLPPRPPRPKGGRPIIADRDVLTGIVFMLKTGIAWEDLPTEMGCGCGMTCLRRLREWQRAGIWPQIQEILQAHLRENRRIDWSRVRVRIGQPISTPRHLEFGEPSEGPPETAVKVAQPSPAATEGSAGGRPPEMSLSVQAPLA